MTRPTVRVIVLGGTITMAPSGSSGIVPSLTGADLIKLLPGLEKDIDVVVETPFLKPGASIEPEEIAEIVASINNDQSANYAGTVLVQGTDTIDETSFLAGLLYGGEAPIVVTGAMRGASALGADGPANLYTAINIAGSPAARGLGVLVTLNDEIHAAQAVEKMHKGLVSSFESPNGGPLGYFFENQVRIIRRPAFRAAAPLAPKRFAPVAVVKVGLGSDDRLLNAIPELGYEGLVVEATGVGHLGSKLVPALSALSARMPVVLASRVPGGPIFHSTYGFPGSEIDLLSRGLIPGEWLSTHKARLLLSTALGAETAEDDLIHIFQRYGQP